MPRLSVIVPATNRPSTLERVIAAIERTEAPPDELIVVDSPPGAGPAAARNLGARRARGDVLVFVDADIEVHRDVFFRLRAAFDRDAELAAVFGSYDDDPGSGELVSDFRNLLHHHVHHEAAGPATTFWAGLGAIRRDVFIDAGGFDEARFPLASVEDIELGSRLYAHGKRVLLDPAIQGKHLKTWTLATMTTTDLLRRGVPWLRLVLENRPGLTALNLGWRHRVSTGATLLLVYGLLRRRPAVVGSMLMVVIALERAFYRLLLRRGGLRLVLVGIPLHALHRLTSVAAVFLALGAHVAGPGFARSRS